MKKNPSEASELSRRARERLSAQTAASPCPKDTQELIYQLRVHQIELEMQNEELVQARAQVEAGLAHYAQLYDFAPVGYVTLNFLGVIVEINLSGASMLGVERARLKDRRFAQWVSPSDRSRFTAFLGQLFARVDKVVCDVEVQPEGSSPIFVRIQGKATPDGQLCRAVFTDITERRRSENQLRKLSVAVEQSPTMVVITDPRGHIEYVNPKFTQVTGYTLEDVRGQIPRILQSGETGSENYQHCEAAWNTILAGGHWRGEFPNHRKDGTLFWERAAISPICDGAGTMTHLLLVGEDITEQKSLESQLRQAQKMESVGRLAGGVAHDFNNMLGVILGYADMALGAVEPGTPVSDHLREIQQAARRSAELTRQLLAFSRRQAIFPEILDPNRALESMLKVLQRLIGENIQLAWNPGPEVRNIKMDLAQLHQILINLAVNARDSIQGVGILTIETSNVVVDAVFRQTHPDLVAGDHVLLTVADTGKGMDPATLAQIFEPFFTTKEVGEGIGLGLATVYGAVTQNGGVIQVDSQPGWGTTFKIYLPASMAAVVSPPAAVQPVRSDETILLVEDETALLQLVTTLLTRTGYTVLAAPLPQRALELARAHVGPIHMLITDIIMPEMNGKELKNQICALHPDIKVLYVSGYTHDIISERGVLPEGVHFLEKPFTINQLSEKLRDILDSLTNNKSHPIA